jgi:predicted deacylase
MARAFNLPVIWGTSAELDGRSLSVARDAGVPAIYAEYRGSAVCDPQGVEAYLAGCLNVLALLKMIQQRQQESLVTHVIEDTRPGSGHMQVCNPSSMTGFFEPAVVLGETIQAGQLIGTVFDVLGKMSCEIRSQQAGMVLVLRTFSRVLAGESVGVVAEMTPPVAEELS